MLIQDVDNNTFFLYKEGGLIKPVTQEEINKYSFFLEMDMHNITNYFIF
jgi:hypothetical protein